MSNLLSLFAVLAGLAAVLVNIALWSPGNVKIKIGALATMALFLPVAYMSLSDMLSRPKPISIEWSLRQIAEATVLSSHMEEGKAIYLWLGIEDSTEPRAFVLPWNEKMARQLHGARRTAEQTGSNVQMRLPFENSKDRREQVFYAQPQPPAPTKQQPAQNPLNFQNSESNNGSSAN